MEPIFSQFRTLCADAVSGVLEKVALKYDLPFEDLRAEFVTPLLSGQAPFVAAIAAPAPFVAKTTVAVPAPPAVIKPAAVVSPFAAAAAAAVETREADMCSARAVRNMCTRKALPGSCYCKLHGRIAAGEPAFKKIKPSDPAAPVVPAAPPVVPEPAPVVPAAVPLAVVPEPAPVVPAAVPLAVVPEPAPVVPAAVPLSSGSEAFSSPESVSESESESEPIPAPKRSDMRKILRIKMKAAPIVSTKMHDSIFGAAPDDIEIF
jgi:hypothetical protein